MEPATGDPAIDSLLARAPVSTLVDLGLHRATDLEGGYLAWREQGGGRDG